MVKTSNLGYPRIGEHREWKKALENFWNGQLAPETFLQQMKQIRLELLQKQQQSGVDLIPIGDFSFYDHVLDTALMFGLVPQRFQTKRFPDDLSLYFAIARGEQDLVASEMTKWYNTNYHYIVPEWHGQVPNLLNNRPLQLYLEAKTELGIEGKPVIIGPFSFAKLSKGYAKEQFAEVLHSLVAPYAQLLRELREAGVRWVQIDEPSLVTSITKAEMDLVSSVYQQLRNEVPDLSLFLQTYFAAVSFYEDVVALPVDGIGLDFVAGYAGNLEHLRTCSFPRDKVLGLGLIDGRNIWKTDYQQAAELFGEVKQWVPLENIWLQPSCSLLHVPVSLKQETELAPTLKNALAFAEEKLQELADLKEIFLQPESDRSLQKREANKQALQALAQSPERAVSPHQPARVTKRAAAFAQRQPLHAAKWQLPILPTTTIGSFPQTADLRQTRRLWRQGQITEQEYETAIREKIAKWIKLQERLGLDVLVHGEFERTDMVEFFGEKLQGFAFTRNGWVQSYGSRCVKPPIIFGNVRFVEPMTVKETVYAQSLTEKPVKGMLTGPVTILNWSFVRNDLPRQEIAYQIADALIEEVRCLEQAGIEMIQVDEPALREGLPLKREEWHSYLQWAVTAFRIATSDVANSTQIHTHMCYSEFGDILSAIRELDADVVSIETSRSHGELIADFEQEQFDKGIGLGVYDIHSPRIPSEAEMEKILERALSVLPAQLFWVNPDCGLKTRKEEEAIAALEKMVRAAKKVRAKITITPK
ncbi:5-methyltetrahydropteroyltriglutamate--homocysteine S-methyltransferase [Brevibacillus fulvus]|uniref:5-methyltetrahydropteroyltriglutamate--homocysteine methyltransferase n=1 Tax=Brevibacillus fulvus TaxID=1125967 RepID=A0A938Y5E7_9BACL|nr:5-methyltetrahydropteroyltriglutamate--homocysteine S-methyltransferase [Brevibacillus fulvus]MBM7591580.1 5-methyltetrahydropteroyltriglutamate--homocysteine methyltransferase [Brevibacillus fulvus]